VIRVAKPNDDEEDALVVGGAVDGAGEPRNPGTDGDGKKQAY
jgi:hypothetical protein